jgi:hypothetical protein
LFEAKPDLINMGHTEIYFCEEAPIELFRVFLDYYINKSGKDPVRLTLLAVKKIDKLKELMLTYDICNIKNLSKLYICELFMECIINSVNIETVLFIEQHFNTTLKEIKTKPESECFGYLNLNYICDNVILNDNLELYNHMRQSGFQVDDHVLHVVVRERCIKITPGLVKKHIAEGYHAENYDAESYDLE